jgi:hypothetical protein
VLDADDLTTFMWRMSWKSGSLNFLEPSGPQRACYGTPLPFIDEYGPTVERKLVSVEAASCPSVIYFHHNSDINHPEIKSEAYG